MLQVQLPNGTLVDISPSATALDVAAGIGERLAKSTIAATVDGTVVDCMRPLADLTSQRPIPVRLITERDSEAPGALRHSCAHVMACAVMRLFPGTGLAFGPTTGNGFYYDFDLATPISEDDFPRIEAEMQRIIDAAEPFERFETSREEALTLCSDLHQTLKTEHIRTGLAEHPTLSFYRQGEFLDLCRGPHIPHAGKIKAFKVTSVAAAFWKGNSSGPRLQRLYGTAYFDRKDLKAWLEQLEEARKRDHRVLGKRLGLFSISNDVGQDSASGSRRRHHPRDARRIHQIRTPPPRLPTSLLTTHRPRRDVRNQRPLPLLPRFSVRPHFRSPRRTTHRSLDPWARPPRYRTADTLKRGGRQTSRSRQTARV
ncbi:MAG UNVERIFIED_CONTAM: TGS domain-containing protein [Planctomycetaceae bacterium]